MLWGVLKRSVTATMFAGLLVGCSPAAQVPSVEPPKTQKPPEISGKGTEVTSPEGLAELSEADRESALQQKLCPVTGEPLGSMGAPLQVQVKDRSVWICCDGCEGRLKKDPDKYLAKLKN